MRVFLGNASWGMPEWEKELDLDTFDTLFASNVRAAFFLVAAFAPAMAARGKGSSMTGQIGFAGGAAYEAAKGALSSLTRAWAAEFSPSGVRVHTIAPGPVSTEGVVPACTTALETTTLLKCAAPSRSSPPLWDSSSHPSASSITGTVVAADGGRMAI